MKQYGIALLLGCCLLPFVGEAAFAEERGSWFIGFGIQPYSRMWINDKEPPSGGWKTGMNFLIGGTINKHLLMGGELAGVTYTYTEKKTEDILTTETSTTVNLSLTGVTFLYFPFEKGLYFKGTPGVATFSTDSSIKSDLKVGTTTAHISATKKDSDTGFGGQAGIGYAFWLGKSFNLTLESQFFLAKIGSEKARYWNGGVGFHWY